MAPDGTFVRALPLQHLLKVTAMPIEEAWDVLFTGGAAIELDISLLALRVLPHPESE